MEASTVTLCRETLLYTATSFPANMQLTSALEACITLHLRSHRPKMPLLPDEGHLARLSSAWPQVIVRKSLVTLGTSAGTKLIVV